LVRGIKMSSASLTKNIPDIKNQSGKTLKNKNKNKVKDSRGDKIYYTIVYILLIIILLIVLYPLIYILSASFSSPHAVSTGKVILFPVEFSLEGYKAVFRYKDVIIGYRNTLYYTIVGTAINVALTLMAAYPLSRKTLPGRGFITFLFTFTMLFSGGMVPHYILMSELNLLNKPWTMLIPGAISITNLIITRTFMINNIPSDLLEAAQIDGCSDIKYFFSVILPLSKANIAVSHFIMQSGIGTHTLMHFCI